MTDPATDRAIVWLPASSARALRRAIASRRGVISAQLEAEPDDGDTVRELLEEIDELVGIDAQLARFLADVGA